MAGYPALVRTAITALDHLVFATPDLAATSAMVARCTGVEPLMGGQHVGKGTCNMLCSFGPSSYLEIVGPDPQQADPPGPRPFGIDDLREAALVAWAIAVQYMDKALRNARAGGHDPGDAAAMQRRRPDGVLLSWELTMVPSPAVPFLIDWLGSPHPASSSPSGLKLLSLTATHPQPERYIATMKALGIEIDAIAGAESLHAVIEGPLGQLALTNLT
jgi:hypothetical protein